MCPSNKRKIFMDAHYQRKTNKKTHICHFKKKFAHKCSPVVFGAIWQNGLENRLKSCSWEYFFQFGFSGSLIKWKRCFFSSGPLINAKDFYLLLRLWNDLKAFSLSDHITHKKGFCDADSDWLLFYVLLQIQVFVLSSSLLLFSSPLIWFTLRSD